MKRLIIIRHAKSDWNTGEIDFERPLNKRGKKEAPIVGNLLKNEGLLPDLIVSSSAKRTTETSILIAKELNYPIENIQYDDSIYEAPVERLIKAVWMLPNEMNTVCLVGHNPGVSALASYFINDWLDFKTANAAVLEAEVDDWSAWVKDTAMLIQFITPK